MNQQKIKQALNRLVDQAIPENYDPRLAVRARLATSRTTGGLSSHHTRPDLRLAWAGLVILLVIGAGTLFFLTPQGHAFAQGILRFFNRADSDVLPVMQPTEPPHPTRTPAATQRAELQAVTPAAQVQDVQGYPIPTPASPSNTGPVLWNLTLNQAAQSAGFTVRVPTSLPPGYRLENVIYDPHSGEVSQFYEFHPYSAGELFILSQRVSPPSDLIGQSAVVEQLTIGENIVEYVKGGWFVSTGSGLETWQSDALYHTFRWQEDKFTFTLVFMFDEADTWSPAYWTRNGMLAMVEVVMGIRSDFPEQVNYNNLTSVSQAEQIAGFHLSVPTILPEGFVFSRAVYEPQSGRVLLFFQPSDSSLATSGVSLLLIEALQDAQSAHTWDVYPPGAVEAVLVNGLPATFVRGMVVDGTYEAEGRVLLVWSNGELSIELSYSSRSDYPTRLEKEDLLSIAESIK